MKILLSLAIGYTSFLVGQTLVMATPAPVNSTINQIKKVSFNPPPAPASEPPPGGRVRGGAKRGLCPSVQPQLTALVPYTEDTPTVTNVWGLTTEAHPTLMFYMPYAHNVAYPTEFVLQDQESNSIYQTAIALPAKPGIIRISVPQNITLAVNKRYRWFLTVDCDPQKDSPPTYVEGVIKRVTLNKKVTEKLKTATPLQRFDIYLQNGIWHEALKTLSQLHQENPKDQEIKVQWQNLLTSIRLEDVASQPLLPSEP
ncbi:DUF928 domain-containing protein [Anabaena sp. UHCC 0399]|uniref:DUF928 domain-containing protein n=1 Tax=Anabaena sp. UHCC 0399 TaxID=3110238 RepID=UPI002B1F6063|nr:DUF928 domain-containing protein [Anabaena sp. UHCC 0399]MEA5563933.1 DUF928 domain-containing protein [Anabaena sp. UHCC 0399]